MINAIHPSHSQSNTEPQLRARRIIKAALAESSSAPFKLPIHEWPSSSVSESHKRRAQWLADQIRAKERYLLARVPPALIGSLECIQGRVAPMPRAPAFFSKAIGSSCTRFLLERLALIGLEKQRTLIEVLFSKSRFSPENPFFRTTRTQGFSFIEGDDSPSWRNLVSMLHELGHCLQENLPDAEYRALLPAPEDSATLELLPHWFEESAGKKILARDIPKAVPEWDLYLRCIDLLNLGYFGIEYGLANPWEQAVIAAISPRLHLLRESLEKLPGYQLDYAEASLLRLNSTQDSVRSMSV